MKVSGEHVIAIEIPHGWWIARPIGERARDERQNEQSYRGDSADGVRDAFKRNDYWVTALSQAQSKPESLAEIERGSKFYRDVQPADLNPLVKQYLQRDRASICTVLPEKKN